MVWDLTVWAVLFAIGFYAGTRFAWYKARDFVWEMVQRGELDFTPKSKEETL